MTTNEFLKATENLAYEVISERLYPVPRPRVICKDGYSVSIQANVYVYCEPRENKKDFYSEVELGFPNQYDELLDDYNADPLESIDTIYGYVPVELVDLLLEKHGGIDHW